MTSGSSHSNPTPQDLSKAAVVNIQTESVDRFILWLDEELKTLLFDYPEWRHTDNELLRSNRR